MWERKELKEKAKKVVHRNYWTAIVVCFLIALLTGEFGTSILGIWQSEDSMDPYYVIHHQMDKIEIENYEMLDFLDSKNIRNGLNEIQTKVFKTIEANLNSAMKPQKYIFKIWDGINSFQVNQMQLGVLLCIGSVIALAFTILVADPLIVGEKKYFLKARRNNNTKIGVITEVFQKGIGFI